MIASSLVMARPVHGYFVDDLSPWAIRFSNGMGVRWYGLAYLAGAVAAGLILLRWVRRGRLSLNPDDLFTFLLYAELGVVVGGRLGYCLFYNFPAVVRDPLEVFAVWHGGMASHGGIAGLVIAVWMFALNRRVSPLSLVDAVAATGFLGVAFGRVANFVNGELWGRPATVPWAVIFPQAPLVNELQVPRHPSQLYAAMIEGLFVFAIGQWVYAKSARPGLTASAVCMTYGVGRFIDEFWREPDLGQPVFWGWMSKGQLLTIPMIFVGVVGLFVCTTARYPRGKERVPTP